MYQPSDFFQTIVIEPRAQVKFVGSLPGDTIVIDANSSQFTIAAIGANLVIKDHQGSEITIPLTPEPTTIQFADGSTYDAEIHDGKVVLIDKANGEQMVIPNTPQTLFSPTETQPEDLTIMVYAAGDNDLSNSLKGDIEEIKSVDLPENIDVTIMFDGENEDTYLYHLSSNDDFSQDWGEKNTGDPETLSKFIDWSVEQAPADKYMLIISGHGDGFNTAFDDENQDELTLSEIASAIANSKLHKVDVLGFDACLMATLDTAYGLKDVCDLLVASEDEEPGFGWDYDAWLENLKATNDYSLQYITEEAVHTYIQNCNSFGEAGTLGVIDESKIDNVYLSFEKFKNALFWSWLSFPEEQETFYNALYNASQFGDCVDLDLNKEFIDIGSFAQNLINYGADPQVTNSAEELLNSLNETVILTEKSFAENENTYVHDIYGLTVNIDELSFIDFYL